MTELDINELEEIRGGGALVNAMTGAATWTEGAANSVANWSEGVFKAVTNS
ncbi:hypothetical protein [Pseudomonas sp. S35]|uniref:hypothetical protein n=1 Tax=Pseudomonas sp. S35 TaxID=1573719 RepID=UPI00135C3196|nr:hypothetical protein [Pseudomonas sp. S35]